MRPIVFIILLLPLASLAQSPGGVSTNLSLWLKADAATFSDAGTTPATDGVTVQQWNDQSGTAKNASQATAGFRPTYYSTTNQMNYNPLVRFDGTSQTKMDIVSVLTTGNANYDIFTASTTTGNDNNASHTLFSQGNGGSTGNTLAVNYSYGGTANLAVGHAWTGTNFQSSDNAVVANKPNIIEFSYNSTGTVRDMLLQGVSLGTNNSATLSMTVNASLGYNRRLNNAFYFGDMTEIIAYTDLKNSTDRSKVQSYLALKYGTTLSNAGGGTNGDYLSSGGTTIWDADNVSGYQNNVIGVGRDDASGLYQKQSHQADDSTRIYLSTLQTSNTANTGTFSGDGQFVMMGNNAARMYNNTSNAEFPSGFNISGRFDREWKITNTGFTGTFSIDIKPEAGTYDITKLRVLIDDDGNFSNATAITPAVTYASGVITISEISNAMIGSGITKYITLSVITPTPGGISTNLTLWNKANTGVSVSGATVTDWADQTAINTFTVTGSPQLDSTAINYNPSVTFDGSSRFTGNTGLNNITQAFAVGKITSGGGTTGALIGSAADNGFRYFFHTEGNRVYCAGDVASVFTAYANGSNAIPYSLLSEDLSKTPAASDMIRLNGLNKTNAAGGNPVPFTTAATPTIGSRATQNLTSGSGVAEAILYSASLSATNVNKVESYLALKYGITLSNSGGGTNGDYTSSGDSLIWDADNGSAYHNNVIGIGRDDASGLYQKQSHQADDSTRIYLNTLQTSSASNSGTFGSDGQFILMGNNNAPLRHSYTNTEYPAGQGIYSRLDREWKIANTAFTGTFSVDIKPNTSPITASDLRVLIDDDGNFTNATLYNPSISYSSGVITVSGISNSEIPVNSTKYLTVVSMNSTTPLPVELINFTAKPVNNKYVQLDWQTVSEINSASFIIERSADGAQWQQVTIVNAAGDSSSLLSYSYNDNTPIDGISYYRIKQTDIDGKYKMSAIRNVSINIFSANKLRIYPNPTSDKVMVEGEKGWINSIAIYDAIGRTVNVRVTIINEGSALLEMGNLPVGIYAVKAKNASAIVWKK